MISSCRVVTQVGATTLPGVPLKDLMVGYKEWILLESRIHLKFVELEELEMKQPLGEVQLYGCGLGSREQMLNVNGTMQVHKDRQ